MIFNSFAFAVFICVTLVCLALLPTRGRVCFLIAASYLFYSVTYPPWLVLLLACTLVDYRLARMLEGRTDRGARVALLLASCVLNLGLLAFYKYAAFIATTVNGGAAMLGIDLRLPVLAVGLPLGISFYVFESMSYVIDVYRGRTPAIRRLTDYALFIAFFPHLIAGPIVRARDFVPQIAGHQPFARDKTIRGVELIALGFFKKTVIADNCAPLVDAVYSGPALAGGAALWLATMFFAVQIYCDFSGYTDIARGLANVMGFELGLNFKFPYLSRSIRDFWRRWHLSLSAWLRDYLYIPLGGSRQGRARMAVAITLTWLLGGLWHGAAWNFVAWGLFHGVLVSMAAAVEGRRAGALWDRLPALFQIGLTFALVLWGWVLFRADNVTQAFAMWRAMIAPRDAGFMRGAEIFSAFSLTMLAFAAALHAITYWIRRDAERPFLIDAPYMVRAGAIALTGLACFLFAGKAQTFIYFQF